MKRMFLNEWQCYQILEQTGIATPRSLFLETGDVPAKTPFKKDEAVVYKAVVDDVWHKSDLGLIRFANFSNDTAAENYRYFRERNPQKTKWRGLLVCEKIAPAQTGLPAELLLSIRHDAACGPVLSIGLGGIHTELWGSALKNGLLSFPMAMMDARQAARQFAAALPGKILLGKVRQGTALTDNATIDKLFAALWALAPRFDGHELALLEINPLTVDKAGRLLALDAVGQKYTAVPRQTRPSPALPADALFRPKHFVIAGVSSKKRAFGNLIINNLKESLIPASAIRVLKPGSDRFEGYTTIASLKELSKPVDVLILAVPASAAIDLIDEACALQAARIIYLVSGGIGDSADTDNILQKKLQAILSRYPADKRPRIIGPNSLGILLAPLKVNTLFIPPEKLPVRFFPQGGIGLIAQSGAFFITRISRNPALPVAYGFCIGNQSDVSATELLQALATEEGIRVIGLYLEGAPQGDALSLARAVRRIASKKRVIIYRGGRSRAGMKAAAGHTGALASEYGIEKKLLQQAGAIVCERFVLFENSLKWYHANPDFSADQPHGISVMTNAGYESVACADGLGEHLAPLTEAARQKLTATLETFRLTGIVSPSNPLDLTPMAGDDAYYECARVLLQQPETSLLVMGIVPLTAMINTHDPAVRTKNAQRLRELSRAYQKPIAIVIDAGSLYRDFKAAFAQAGLAVFDSMQEMIEVMGQGQFTERER